MDERRLFPEVFVEAVLVEPADVLQFLFGDVLEGVAGAGAEVDFVGPVDDAERADVLDTGLPSQPRWE